MLSQRCQAILMLGVLFMLLTVCDAVDPNDEIDTTVPFTLQVSLRNDSGRSAQILGPGDQPNPALVLAPSQSRSLDLGHTKHGDVFRFRALIFEESIGGAWLEVANQACRFDSQRTGSEIVSYRGGIALVCENW